MYSQPCAAASVRALSVAAVAEALALSCSLAQETLNPCHAQKEGADGGLSGEVQTSVYSGVLHGKCLAAVYKA